MFPSHDRSGGGGGGGMRSASPKPSSQDEEGEEELGEIQTTDFIDEAGEPLSLLDIFNINVDNGPTTEEEAQTQLEELGKHLLRKRLLVEKSSF